MGGSGSGIGAIVFGLKFHARPRYFRVRSPVRPKTDILGAGQSTSAGPPCAGHWAVKHCFATAVFQSWLLLFPVIQSAVACLPVWYPVCWLFRDRQSGVGNCYLDLGKRELPPPDLIASIWNTVANCYLDLGTQELHHLTVLPQFGIPQERSPRLSSASLKISATALFSA